MKDSRIKVFFREHEGVAPQLNFLIGQAKGDYIAMMDSDDDSAPNRLELQLHYMTHVRPEINVLSCLIYSRRSIDEGLPTEQWIDLEESWLKISEIDELDYELTMRNQFSHPCLFIKTDVARQFMYRNVTY